MKILFLAPQPFFQERGTPIAVRLALKVLANTNSYKIDLLTFHEGQNLEFNNVEISRIRAPAFLNGVGPGFSLKKILCDIIFFFHALIKLIKTQRTSQKYQLVHAVEESVFMALVFKWIFKIPYIYDMDSCLALQLTEKLPFLKPFNFFFEYLESLAIRNCVAVIPVCDALAAIAQNREAEHIELLPDISLASEGHPIPGKTDINLRKVLNIATEQRVILYVGNLETYQGVDLLLRAFSEIAASFTNWCLVIIGGRPKHIEAFKAFVDKHKLNSQILLAGPRSVSQLDSYLKQADILASPRIMGNNTPMKIYSYMHSGVPIIATDLATHTQVLTSEMAYLVEPEQSAFAAGLKALIEDKELRLRLANRAFAEVEQKYTFEVFSKNLCRIYQNVSSKVMG